MNSTLVQPSISFATDRPEPSTLRSLIFVLLCSLILSVIGLNWGLPSIRGWAPDEITPTQVRDGARQFFANGWHHTYPPLHFALLALIFSPLIKLHEIGIITGDLNLLLFQTGRLTTVLMSQGALILLFLCGKRLFGARAGIWAALLLALTPQFAYYSKMMNLDLPYLFWLLAALLFYLRALETQRLCDYIGLSCFAAISVCTKDQAAGYFIVMPILLIVSALSKSPPKAEKRSKFFGHLSGEIIRNFAIAGLISLTLFVLLHNILFNQNGFLEHLEILFGPIREKYYIVEPGFGGAIELLFITLRIIAFCFGYLSLALVALGIYLTSRDSTRRHLLLYLLAPVAVYYIVFIQPIRFTQDRFFIPTMALLSLFGGYGAAKLEDIRIGKLALLACVLFGALRASSVDALMLSDSRYELEKWLGQGLVGERRLHYIGRLEYAPRLPKGLELKSHPAQLGALDWIKGEQLLVIAEDLSRYKEGSDGYKLYSRLFAGKTSCRESARLIGEPRINFLDARWEYGNIIKVNPELRLYRCGHSA